MLTSVAKARTGGSVLVATLACACGSGTAGPGLPSAPVPGATLPMPSVPNAPPGDTGGAQAAQTWRVRLNQAHGAVRAYTAQMAYFQKASGQMYRGAYDLRGRTPRNLRIQILQGNGQGTKLSWTGGRTIKVRAAGLLGAVTLDLPLTDPRIISPRGYTLDQIDLPGLLSLVNHPGAQVTFLGEQGGQAYLRVTGNHLLAGTTSLVTGIDTRTGFANFVEMSDAREPLVRIDLKQFRPVSDVSLDI